MEILFAIMFIHCSGFSLVEVFHFGYPIVVKLLLTCFVDAELHLHQSRGRLLIVALLERRRWLCLNRGLRPWMHSLQIWRSREWGCFQPSNRVPVPISIRRHKGAVLDSSSSSSNEVLPNLAVGIITLLSELPASTRMLCPPLKLHLCWVQTKKELTKLSYLLL